MKLRNKLLPLVALGATACTITPVLTSCKNNEKKEETITLTNLDEYESTIDAHTGTDMTRAAAAKAYFGAKNSADIIKNDIMLYLQAEKAIVTKLWDSEEMKVIKYLLGIDWVGTPKLAGAYINIDEINFNAADDTATDARVKGQIVLKMTADVLDSEGGSRIGDYVLEMGLSFTDMHYSMMWGTLPDGTMHFNTHIDDAGVLATDAKWSMVRAYSGTCTYLDGKVDSASSQTNYNKDNTFPSILGSFITWYSSYLWDCKEVA